MIRNIVQMDREELDRRVPGHFYTSSGYEYAGFLVDVAKDPPEILGSDAVEPEDASFNRDLGWLADLVISLSKECNELTAQNAELTNECRMRDQKIIEIRKRTQELLDRAQQKTRYEGEGIFCRGTDPEVGF